MRVHYPKCIWPILLIKSDLKWYIHFIISRILFYNGCLTLGEKLLDFMRDSKEVNTKSKFLFQDVDVSVRL